VKLKNKTIYITGAASGIGKSIAESCAEAGANVAIADLNIQEAQKVASELMKKTQKEHLAFQVDVTKEVEVNRSIDETVKKFGRLDILISNAGIQTIAPVHELELAQWQKMLSIHLDGAFLTTKACLKYMYPARSGKIIYVGSVHSKLASKLKAPYVTAKHGLIGLNKVVAQEAAQYNVSSHVICPGFVKTPLVEKQIPEQAKELNMSEEDVIKKIMLKDTVDGEFTSLKDLADCAVFLAGFDGLALTGQSFIVSHGWYME